MIWRPGIGPGLQGVGFAGDWHLRLLYFASHHWPMAGFTLTAFGGFFADAGAVPAGCRIGLAALKWRWSAADRGGRSDAAGAGVGRLGSAGRRGADRMRLFTYFPSLGVEVVSASLAQVRGTAPGGYAAFRISLMA